MEFENHYTKEYRMYMEYALQNYLIQRQGYAEDEAKLKVAQDYDEVMEQAKKDKYL